ncbi:amidohydrolase family protein [Pseudonocardia kujensis]|uniref:amidohydrolase family protein n=1 Tax=Pseudonocardia kujensis TaxID=1128675 RepID=UPI001E4AE5AC|nr:amidohydrolase family protein [Pseudonocardia kujensis]MCE0762756.1 amidohydrolase family protein [Pseudonocardia kujensis]
MTGLLLRDAEVDGERVDVLVREGLVAALSPVGTLRGPAVDCGGGALLPGLVDHHLHLHALAAARRSVDCSVPDLAAALAAARADAHGWVRGTGYPGDDLDVRGLDALHADRPVRVQHRSGALWVLNSLALAALGPLDHPGVERAADGTPTGRLFRADDWLRARLPGSGLPDLSALGTELAGYGITAVTDATPDLSEAAARALTAMPQRVTLLGLPVGATTPPGAAVGPLKIVLADSGLPPFDALVARIREAHAAGRGVAVHSVTRESLVLLLAALDEAGRQPADRVEHAALVPEDLVPALRGLAVVTQPGFLADRGDLFRREVPAEEHADLYRCRSLLDAGVGVAFSSDAPYGPVDPWAVIAAATTRRTPDGAPLGRGEAVEARQAVEAYLAPPDDPGGPPRRVSPGASADLVLLHRPLAPALATPSAALVRGTVIGGRWVYGG